MTSHSAVRTAVCALVLVLTAETGLGRMSDPVSTAWAAALHPQAIALRLLPTLAQGATNQPAAVTYQPRIFFVDVEAGPVRGGPNDLGAPVSIFGKGFGATRGGSRVTIGGVEVAGYMVWGSNNAHNRMLDMIVVQPGPKVTGGPIEVTVNGKTSNADQSFAVNSGRIYYVAPGGSDSAGCSASSPCATVLKAAADVMRPGDIVLVRGGRYAEGEIWIRADKGGSAGRPKVIRNHPGEEPYFENPARGFLVDANYITVSGLNFRNGKALAAVGWASASQAGNRFINNTFSGNIEWAAIDSHGSDHLVAGNVCDVSGSTVGTMGHCYYIASGSNLRILYNVGGGPPGYGLHVFDQRRSANDFQRVIRNVVVEGNVFKGSTQRSGMIVSMGDEGGKGNVIENVTIRNNVFTANNLAGLVIQGIARNIKVYNNTFYQNGRQAMYIANDANLQQVDVRNNLFFQGPGSVCRENCAWFAEAHVEVGAAARGVTLSNNSYHPNAPVVLGRADASPASGRAQFLDAAVLDFHLMPGSTAIDRGTALDAVQTDFDGRQRPQGSAYDTGAFEYAARPPAISSVLNGATMLEGPLAPGEIVAVTGWNLGPLEPVEKSAENGSATTSLAGTTALFDDTPAPLISVADTGVIALVPYQLSRPDEVKVQVDVAGELSNAVSVPIASASPGIFTADRSGRGPAYIRHEDSSLNSVDNPASRSSVITFYSTGLGPTEPAAQSGRLASDPLPRPAASVSVWIGHAQAELVYAGAVSGQVENLTQIDARIPETAEGGDAVPLVIKVADRASRGDVTLSIR